MKRLFVIGGIALFGVVGLGAPAFAHSEFQPASVAPNKAFDGKLFIEDEQSAATTSKVELFLPTDGSVKVTAAPTPSGVAVVISAATVVWSGNTTDGNLLLPLTMSLPAKLGRLQFKVVQTYSNGTVDRWIAANPVGGTAPDNPGPVIDIAESGTATTEGSAHDHAGGSHDATTTMGEHGMAHDTKAATTTTAAPKKSSSSNSGAIIGIAAAVVVLGGGGLVALRSRKKS